ncbi:MAG: hypothetical protein B7Z75_12260 [Acidocella sp. 20-57-95]|nr:MAG: hypothetical protein B7Z75_12260 [Acidocella sp. 20-57-95]OYV61720.1 MAG: hypothetical protein B7Z71_04210 [Acidocella sp. 21-58-7]
MTTRFMNKLRTFGPQVRAVTSVEYSLLSAMVGVVIIASVSTLASNLNSAFDSVSRAFPAVTTGAVSAAGTNSSSSAGPSSAGQNSQSSGNGCEQGACQNGGNQGRQNRNNQQNGGSNGANQSNQANRSNQ